MSFINFILISILQIIFFAACDSVAMYEKFKNNSTCKISNDSVITWDVLDFVSIIKWKPAECATDIKDYVIQVCIPMDNCKEHSHDWTSYECEKFQATESMFSCHVDIPAIFGAQTSLRICVKQKKQKRKGIFHKICKNYGKIYSSIKRKSKFTAPIINVSSVDMTSFTVSSRVQSGNFMCYMRYIAYELKTIKLAGNQTCEEAMKNPKPIRSTKITREATQADCDGQNDSLVTWSVDKLNPDSKYCVYGSYTTKITSNANGPSKVGFTSEPIITHKDYIWKSPYFIVGITIAIFVVIGLVIVFIFIYSKPPGSGLSPVIQDKLGLINPEAVHLEICFDALTSQDNSEAERVDKLTPEEQEELRKNYERKNHQETEHHHQTSRQDEAIHFSANEEDVEEKPLPDCVNKSIENGQSHPGISFDLSTNASTSYRTNSTFTSDEPMTGTDSYRNKDDKSPLLPDDRAYLQLGKTQFTSRRSKQDQQSQFDLNQHVVYEEIVGVASTEADVSLIQLPKHSTSPIIAWNENISFDGYRAK